MNMQSEWIGTAALLRHYHEVRTRLRTPPNAVPDTGINLKHDQLGRKGEPEATPKPQPLPYQYKEKVKNYRHTYRTSFRPSNESLNIRTVLDFVAKEFRLSRRTIRSRERNRDVVLARQIAVYLTAKLTTHSIASMADYLARDHTSLHHGQQTIAAIMAESGPKALKINDIETRLLAAFPRAALSTFYKQPVAVEPGAGPQVPAVHQVDS